MMQGKHPPKHGKRSADAELRRVIRYETAKRAEKFAGELPDFKASQPAKENTQ